MSNIDDPSAGLSCNQMDQRKTVIRGVSMEKEKNEKEIDDTVCNDGKKQISQEDRPFAFEARR